MPDNASTFRERAGVYASLMIIVAHIAIGFLQTALTFYSGQEFTVDPGWASAMNALAGGAIGFLVGKQTTNQPGTTTITPSAGVVTTTITADLSEGKA
ncbi:hypothetical protein C8J32_1086 [Rhizobium sp. PP-CC-3A-592]|nr:hypothetical protein C8J32_1086 [Rhizobium sp. PP-CC-3A-592]